MEVGRYFSSEHLSRILNSVGVTWVIANIVHRRRIYHASWRFMVHATVPHRGNRRTKSNRLAERNTIMNIPVCTYVHNSFRSAYRVRSIELVHNADRTGRNEVVSRTTRPSGSQARGHDDIGIHRAQGLALKSVGRVGEVVDCGAVIGFSCCTTGPIGAILEASSHLSLHTRATSASVTGVSGSQTK